MLDNNNIKEVERVLEKCVPLIVKEVKEKEKLFKNPNRKEILKLVKKKPLGIKKIADKIKLSHKNTWFHIKKLKETGYVKTEKQHKESGRPVIVSWTGLKDEISIHDFVELVVKNVTGDKK